MTASVHQLVDDLNGRGPHALAIIEACPRSGETGFLEEQGHAIETLLACLDARPAMTSYRLLWGQLAVLAWTESFDALKDAIADLLPRSATNIVELRAAAVPLHGSEGISILESLLDDFGARRNFGLSTLPDVWRSIDGVDWPDGSERA